MQLAPLAMLSPLEPIQMAVPSMDHQWEIKAKVK